jgi:hypothetical protein
LHLYCSRHSTNVIPQAQRAVSNHEQHIVNQEHKQQRQFLNLMRESRRGRRGPKHLTTMVHCPAWHFPPLQRVPSVFGQISLHWPVHGLQLYCSRQTRRQKSLSETERCSWHEEHQAVCCTWVS